MKKLLDRVVGRVDRYQRSHAWLGFPLGVAKKFGEDQAGNLAAAVAYYGFFSLFPLLLVFVSVLGILLRGNEELQRSILDSALAQFPVIGEQISENLGSIEGSGVALAVGIAGALWAGLGVTQAMQNALNDVWDVPIKSRPTFIQKRVRGLLILAALGTLTVVGAFLASLGAGGGALSGVLRVVGIAGGLAVNFVLFMLAFKILTEADIGFRDVLPGAILAAVAWAALQAAGAWYISSQLTNASETYGALAFVIVLLLWMYLGAQVTLYAAEVNVVRKRRLWPRALQKDDLTEADERSLREHAEVEERRRDEDVRVHFEAGGRAAARSDGTRQAVEEAREALRRAEDAIEREKADRGTGGRRP